MASLVAIECSRVQGARPSLRRSLQHITSDRSVPDERREEVVLLRVLVDVEGELVARRRALVAVGALAEAAGDADGHRHLAQVGGTAVLRVGEVLARSRRACRGRSSRSVPRTIEPCDAAAAAPCAKQK